MSDVCRQLGISEATFYVWKKKDGCQKPHPQALLSEGELRKLVNLLDTKAPPLRVVPFTPGQRVFDGSHNA